MKILIVSKCPTHPTNAGNRAWIMAQTHVLEQLGNEVYFLYVEELPMRGSINSYKEDFEKTKKHWSERFHLFKVSRSRKIILNLRKYIDKFFFHNYYSADETYPCGLDKFVNKLDAQYHFDACIVNYVYLSKLLTRINIPKKAISTHDCMAYKNLKVGETCRTMTAHQEAIAMQRCPHIFALQDDEAAYFQFLSPQSKVYKVYSPYTYHKCAVVGNKTILFLSGSNQYNQNGIKWFLERVFPLIRNRFSDARLLIGGGICKVLNDIGHIQGVELLGYIDNPADFYAKGDIAINPVYQGTGLKIKTFEAISYDKVTMVHPHSMAGVFKKEQAPLFASEKPEEWVSYLEKIWSNHDEITTVKNHNKEYLEEMNAFIINEYKRFLSANN